MRVPTTRLLCVAAIVGLLALDGAAAAQMERAGRRARIEVDGLQGLRVSVGSTYEVPMNTALSAIAQRVVVPIPSLDAFGMGADTNMRLTASVRGPEAVASGLVRAKARLHMAAGPVFPMGIGASRMTTGFSGATSGTVYLDVDVPPGVGLGDEAIVEFTFSGDQPITAGTAIAFDVGWTIRTTPPSSAPLLTNAQQTDDSLPASELSGGLSSVHRVIRPGSAAGYRYRLSLPLPDMSQAADLTDLRIVLGRTNFLGDEVRITARIFHRPSNGRRVLLGQSTRTVPNFSGSIEGVLVPRPDDLSAGDTIEVLFVIRRGEASSGGS